MKARVVKPFAWYKEGQTVDVKTSDEWLIRLGILEPLKKAEK